MSVGNCRGCQREDLHKMCPTYGTPFYMSELPYTEKIESARNLSWRIHLGQKRWNGSNYFEDHINSVVAYLVNIVIDIKDTISIEDIEYIFCLAYLHDTVEDCKDEDLQFLNESLENFPDIQDDLMLLTRKKDIPYFDYIKKIADNASSLCLLVKMADLHHNASSMNDEQKLKDKYSKYMLSGHLLGIKLKYGV